MTTRWRTTRYRLAWKNWGDQCRVVYHNGSGDTHLLNELGVAVLSALGGNELPASKIANRVAHSHGYDSDKAFADQVNETLTQFDEVGLIEPVL